MQDNAGPTRATVVLCPGQGAQAVGMGARWAERSPASGAVFGEADRILRGSFDRPLSELCFAGPADVLNRTDISQPAIFACSIASIHGLEEAGMNWSIRASAGLSLGEYTALCLAGVFDFETGLRLVARRGRLMQDAAEASEGGMVALIGAEEPQANELCGRASEGGVLVCANFNAPGQIVLSGDRAACDRAVRVASEMGLRATALTVAGAFHSPHMQPAAEGLAEALAKVPLGKPRVPVWSNVTAEAHDPEDGELLRQRLVQQLVSPVKWAQTCENLIREVGSADMMEYHETAPGSVLRGLMRRIDRNVKVISHDEP